ncbi:TetR/AcrR family transcriptional regulator [Catenulispora subtropica]|uniref:TetR/AcrR family transcriptional regulator n=1 Tax=Catenulispora subtropica TaxID=450798 RepID=A0ABN2QH26_9ACTN
MDRSRHSDDKILDAAQTALMDLGLRNTTLAEVARRAGVSRMTLYRRYPDIDALLTEVLGRQLMRVVRRNAGLKEVTGADRTARDLLVTGTVEVVRAFHGDLLMHKVLDSDAEFLLPYLTREFGGLQHYALDLMSVRLEQGHEDGSIRSGSVALQARTVLLTAQSFVISARAAGPVPMDRLLEELTQMLDAYLRPTPRPTG